MLNAQSILNRSNHQTDQPYRHELPCHMKYNPTFHVSRSTGLAGESLITSSTHGDWRPTHQHVWNIFKYSWQTWISGWLWGIRARGAVSTPAITYNLLHALGMIRSAEVARQEGFCQPSTCIYLFIFCLWYLGLWCLYLARPSACLCFIPVLCVLGFNKLFSFTQWMFPIPSVHPDRWTLFFTPFWSFCYSYRTANP